jgi:hypothetical protein
MREPRSPNAGYPQLMRPWFGLTWRKSKEFPEDRQMSMQAPDDFSNGLRTIERAIMDGVEAAGGIAAAEFSWSRGPASMRRPETVRLHLRIGSRAVVGKFSREEIEDSSDCVSGVEAIWTVERIVSELNRLLRKAVLPDHFLKPDDPALKQPAPSTGK